MPNFRSTVGSAAFSVVLATASNGQETTLALEDMKEVARTSIEMWTASATIDPSAVFTSTYVNHQEPLADGGVRSIDSATWAQIVETNHKAFPDLTVEVLTQVAEGDQVATTWRFSGTQKGAYEGRAPTGKTVSWAGAQIDRFEGDKIAESWVYWDKFTLFKTLGLID